MLSESSVNNAETVRLRPVVADDEDLLFRVYSSTREDEMKLVPWDEAQREAFLRMQFNAQQQHYQSHFPQAIHEIIERDGQPVGRLYVLREDEVMRILDITILPEFRSAGIGTPLIKDLMKEAATVGKPLQIYVEAYNPSRRLFERLGFQAIEDGGLHILMQWTTGDAQEHSANESAP
jgi:GNAT superfamily N-acetyltransferase